jgi:rRNA maturation endonuclease Nob1
MLIGLTGVFLSQLYAEHESLLLTSGIFVTLAGVLFGKNRLVCSACGKREFAIGADVRDCRACGHPYFKNQEPCAETRPEA